MKKIIFIIISICLFSAVSAQQLQNEEIVVVDGEKYILHSVKQGETIFSVCKHYQIEQKDLVSANPQLIFGLKEGDSLKIPYTGSETEETTVESKTSEGKFIYHVVKKSETIYSISRQYNIPIENIYRYNPEAEEEVLENEIIRIPQNIKETEFDGYIREDDDFFYHKIQPKENAYSLARRYSSSVTGIYKNNPKLDDGFEIGMIVRIPKVNDTSETTTIEESGEYFMYIIESGDTFYSFKRKFGVSQKTLVQLNPALNEGLLAGLTIKVPSTNIPKVEVVPVKPEKFIEHIVSPGETLYSLSKQYNVKVFDIKEWNPELKIRGLIAGETIYVQKPEHEEEATDVRDEPITQLEIPETTYVESQEEPVLPDLIFNVEEIQEPVCKKEFELLDDDTFRISMFLPLFYDKNDTFNLERLSPEKIAYLDSVKDIDSSVFAEYFKMDEETNQVVIADSFEVKEERSLYPLTKAFFPFYEGVLLALDSIQKTGLNVKLNLYDSQYDKAIVDSILYTHDFLNADLIIGPMNIAHQEFVSQFSAKNQIPMVSPIFQDDRLMLNNPFYFQVRPTKDYMLRKTAEFIGDEYYDKNFVIMTLGSYAQLEEGSLVDLIREKFFSSGAYRTMDEVNFTEVDFTEGGNMGYWRIKKVLKPDVENVIFIPATEDRKIREPQLSIAINSLAVLAEDFDITLVGMSDYPQFKSIDTEYFHKLKLHYLTSTYIDYTNPAVCHFIADYREHFNAEPDNMAFMGYDVVKYFAGAYMQLGKHYSECISSYSTGLLQSDFHFEHVNELTGFMNHSLFIMNYTPDFDIDKVAEISEGL